MNWVWIFVLLLSLAPLFVIVWVLGWVMPGMRVLPAWMYRRRK